MGLFVRVMFRGYNYPIVRESLCKLGLWLGLQLTNCHRVRTGKYTQGGLGSVTSKSGESGLNPHRKYEFNWCYASACDRA